LKIENFEALFPTQETLAVEFDPDVVKWVWKTEKNGPWNKLPSSKKQACRRKQIKKKHEIKKHNGNGGKLITCANG